jgi:peptide/nickel transport system substrate-binding protein
MAAAGHANGIKGLDYVVRDLAHHKLWAQAIQQMLQQSLQRRMQSADDCRVGVVRRHQKRQLRFGNRRHWLDLARPSDYFNAWYRTGGPQNYSFWDNSDFQALVPRIDREVDAKQRLTLIRQAEAVMERDPPLVPVAWEKINDVRYNYVKGHNPYEYFGIYDVVRLDTVWLDKA